MPGAIHKPINLQDCDAVRDEYTTPVNGLATQVEPSEKQDSRFNALQARKVWQASLG